jgi:hypothetical protein
MQSLVHGFIKLWELSKEILCSAWLSLLTFISANENVFLG